MNECRNKQKHRTCWTDPTRSWAENVSDHHGDEHDHALRQQDCLARRCAVPGWWSVIGRAVGPIHSRWRSIHVPHGGWRGRGYGRGRPPHPGCGRGVVEPAPHPPDHWAGEGFRGCRKGSLDLTIGTIGNKEGVGGGRLPAATRRFLGVPPKSPPFSAYLGFGLLDGGKPESPSPSSHGSTV